MSPSPRPSSGEVGRHSAPSDRPQTRTAESQETYDGAISRIPEVPLSSVGGTPSEHWHMYSPCELSVPTSSGSNRYFRSVFEIDAQHATT